MATICRQLPLSERKAKLRKLLARARDGIQYVWHVESDGEDSFKAACELGLEGIVSKRLTAPYKSGPCKSWIKVRNPKSAAPCGSSMAHSDVPREPAACFFCSGDMQKQHFDATC